MRAFQGNFNAGIIGPGMYSRTDLGKYQVGVKDAVNVLVRPEGGLFNRAGTKVATGYDVSTVDGKPRLIPFDLSDDARFMLEFADEVMRVMFGGSYVFRDDASTRPITSVSAANPAKLVMGNAGHAAAFTVGHLAYVSDPNGTSVFHGQVVEITAIAGTDITFKIVGGTTANTTTGDWGTIGASAELLGIYQLTSPYAIEHVAELVAAQDLETLYIAHPLYEPRTLTITDPNDWAFAVLATAPDIAAPGSPAAVATTGTGAITYKYKVAALSAESREESLPSAEATVNNDLTTAGNKNTFSWAAVADASSYKVYKDFNGIFGYIGITEGLSFVDENITPDTLDNPQTGRSPFTGAGNYPALFTFIEQRLAGAGSINQPQAAEMSTSVSPTNFNRAFTPGDSDAISFRARAQRQNEIVAIVPSEEPVIFTKGAEGYVRGGDDKGYLTPTNLVLKTTTYRGSAKFPKPLLVGESILHVQRDGGTIREYVPQRTDQESADLTLLARHLFKGRTVKTWAYSQAPDSVVWVTTDLGELYSLTYMTEHEVWGWTRHELGGADVFAHQVEVLPGPGYDEVYLVVSRTLYGGTVTWVETIDPRQFGTDVTQAYFVDAGLTYTGSGTQVVRGFLHLRGEEVVALADGSVLEGITVTAQGRVDLQAATDVAHIGLTYVAEFTTLAVDFSSPQDGSAIGKLKATSRVNVQMEDTRGIAVGREGGFLNEMKQFEGDEPIPLETGTFAFDVEGDWVVDARITVRQRYPLPMTITGVAPDWEASDT